MEKILITGANGQLGLSLKDIAPKYPQYTFLFVGKNELDITNQTAINNYFNQHKITICINCAAYTAVDKAEQQKDEALLANATAVGFLAAACQAYSSQFFHISTDYVFNGTSTNSYKETDITNPVNYYGYTKLQGEIAAQKECPNSIIIRTAWVYSKHGNNFVKTMQRLMAEREQIGVVADQHGIPTNAADLATAIMHIIEGNNFVLGIYHYSNAGATTWYHFATKIASIIQTTCVVNPINTSQFPTPAARPHYSVLDTQKIQTTFNVVVPNWEESLEKLLHKNHP